MKQTRKFQDLTIGDNYMFGSVMMENDNCRQLLERVLEMPISRVEVIKEKSMIYHPKCKGVRLDVYAKDENNTHYDVEMQLLKRDALPKRSRYYHSQMDMELLTSGAKYENLPNTYVIFIHFQTESIVTVFGMYVRKREKYWKMVLKLSF